MRVGGLGVVDVGHPSSATAHHARRGACRPGTTPAPSAIARRARRPRGPARPRPARRARRPVRPPRCDVDRCQCRSVAEGPVDQHPVAHAELAGAGLAEPEPDPDRAAAAASSSRSPRGSSQPDDGDPAVAARAPWPRRRRHRAVPVQVVLGDVEHRRPPPAAATATSAAGSWTAPRPAGPRARRARRSTGQPMLPHGTAAPAGGAQDRLQHRGGGGLAVGAGDHQPAPRRAVPAGLDPAARPVRRRPRPGTPAAAAASGHRRVGGKPGLVTTSAKSPMLAAAGSAPTTRTPSVGERLDSAVGSSSVRSATHAQRGQGRQHRAPVTPAPTTSTRAPAASVLLIRAASLSGADRGKPLAVEQGRRPGRRRWPRAART